MTNNEGLVDSTRHLLFTDNFTKPYTHEHLFVHLFTTALKYITRLFILTDITQYTLNFIYYIMPLYVLLLFILFCQVFILHRVSFICDCTYGYVCNVSSPATEAE